MKRARTASVALLAASVMAVFLAGTAGARQGSDAKAPRSAKGVSNVYIVLLDEAPVAAYRGGIAGYPATMPAAGRKLDKKNANVQKYVGYLRSRHAAVANSVGAARIYDYEYSLNGFAATLNKGQVEQLEASDDVVSVERDSLSHPTTDNTPSFLGLNAGGGIWSQLGGQANAGEDVIVGVVDTGIWPEHPSFADTGFGPAPAGWNGDCESGEQWTQANCTGKLIGARYFNKGHGHFGGGLSGDYQSARDHDGHGTHTASTAAGNAGVNASIFGQSYGALSGMAPKARVAAYKACWPGGCAASDTTEAIDTAVSDGVDVINYSIGDGDPDFLDSDDVGFLFARQAGVFVAASAGNSGPGGSTVDHGGPWLTTVAASTQNRSFVGTATLGNGQTYKGVTVTSALGATALVDAAAAGNELCLVGGFTSSVAGKLVLCKRGSNARLEKSLAVQQAGGVGMILYNANDVQSLNSDNHYVPTVHVTFAQGTAIKAYIGSAGAGATASLSGGQKEFGGGNTMADFSSRGPLLPSSRSTGDLLKPDITAPGVQILAGNSPTAFLGAPGELFQAIAGTSMSSPHIAGIGALLRDLHPDWTPAEMQSAIMTSARQNVFKEDGVTPANPFDFGAGHVVPNGAANPGLVYPAGFDDYRAFLRSQGLCTLCFGSSPAPVVPATDLNVPSVTIRALAGTRTVTRTVKNVGAVATYRARVDAPAGVDVTVTPSRLTLAPGATATYQIEFVANNKASFDRYSFGSLTWTASGHDVRIPLVVRPVRLAAPAAITATGTSGTATRTVRLGYQGTFTVAAQGLVEATTETRTVDDDPTNNFDTGSPDSNQGIQVHSFSVPAGTTLARFQLFDEFTDGTDDIDLYLYRVGQGGALTLVGTSTSGTSAERIDLSRPAAATYKLYVHGWQTDGQSAVYTLFNWLVPGTAAGNMTATSSTSSATVGGTADVTVTWNGLAAAKKWLGRISYGDGSGEIGSTIVSIDS
jgi:subtilisin family serine protease